LIDVWHIGRFSGYSTVRGYEYTYEVMICVSS